MLWHGVKNNRITNIISKLKRKNNQNSIVYNRTITGKFQINKQTFRVYKPGGWSAIILKNCKTNTKVIFFYSSLYYFKLSVPTDYLKLRFDYNSNCFSIHGLYINNNYRLFTSSLDLVFNSFYKPFFRKIKFKGKGYYIYKNKRNTITPQFGYSHRLYLYSYFTSVKFLSKTSVFVFGLTKRDVITTSVGIKDMRPINIFTGRGVRFAREVVYKKVGKVSSYR